MHYNNYFCFIILFSAFALVVDSQLVYNTFTDPVTPKGYAGPTFQIWQLNQLGDAIHISVSGGYSKIRNVSIVLLSTSPYSKFAGKFPQQGWTAEVTLNLFYMENGTTVVSDESRFFTTTQKVLVPWRPEPDWSCENPIQWKDYDDSMNPCYDTLPFVMDFDLSSSPVVVPDEFIFGIQINTRNYGPAPYNTPGPWDTLALGLAQIPPTTGSKIFGHSFVNSTNIQSYGENVGQTNVYRLSDINAPAAIRFQ